MKLIKYILKFLLIAALAIFLVWILIIVTIFFIEPKVTNFYYESALQENNLNKLKESYRLLEKWNYLKSQYGLKYTDIDNLKIKIDSNESLGNNIPIGIQKEYHELIKNPYIQIIFKACTKNSSIIYTIYSEKYSGYEEKYFEKNGELIGIYSYSYLSSIGGKGAKLDLTFFNCSVIKERSALKSDPATDLK